MPFDRFLGEPPVSVATLAKRYSLKPATIRDWLRRGLLPGSNANGRWTTTWDAVFAFEGRLAPPQGEARERAKRPLFNTEQIAERYERSAWTVRDWFRTGRIAGLKIMDAWYADTPALRDFEAGIRP